jgi:hypothetical protein
MNPATLCLWFIAATTTASARWRQRTHSLSFVVFLLLVAGLPARGANIFVTSTDDKIGGGIGCSLKEAMYAAVFSPDATNIVVGTLQLRAERADSGDGRVYLIVVRDTDSKGNTGFSCSSVVVPHDSSASALAAVNSQAATARAYCQAKNGAPPPGYFVIGDGPVIGPKQ